MAKGVMTLERLTERLVKVFSNNAMLADYQKAGETSECFGWDGDVLSPISRESYIKEYGKQLVEQAEEQARAIMADKAKKFEATKYYAYTLQADEHEKNGQPTPKEGDFVWVMNSGMKCEGGFPDAIDNMEWCKREKEAAHKQLVQVAAVFELPQEEFAPIKFDQSAKVLADIIAKAGEHTSGSKSDDVSDEECSCYQDYGKLEDWQKRTFFTLGIAITCGNRWYIVDSEGYDYSRYVFVPMAWETMFEAERKAMKNKTSETLNQNSEDESMTQNLQGADLIGKTIVVNGSNVKYVIKSVDGDKLMTDFIMGDRTMPCPVPMSQVESMVEAGKWTIEGSEEPTATETKAEDVKPEATEEATAEEPTATEEVEEVIDEPEPAPAQTVKMKAASEREQSGAGSDYSEREQARPQVKTEMPKDKAEEKATKSKPQKPQTKAKSDTSHQHSALKYETYTTKKGKTGAKIVGFHETDAAYLAGPELHGSKAWENDKQGNKTFCLLFSHRYAEAAKEVCDALNAGKSVADCQAIVDKTTEERAQRREEWRQKRAEREAQSNEQEQPKAKTEKLYTEGEVRKAFATLADASGVDVKEFEPIIAAMRYAA